MRLSSFRLLKEPLNNSNFDSRTVDMWAIFCLARLPVGVSGKMGTQLEGNIQRPQGLRIYSFFFGCARFFSETSNLSDDFGIYLGIGRGG